MRQAAVARRAMAGRGAIGFLEECVICYIFIAYHCILLVRSYIIYGIL